MKFELNEKQQNKADKWQRKQLKKKAGCNKKGYRFEYRIKFNGIGEIIHLKDLVTKEKIDLTDIDSW